MTLLHLFEILKPFLKPLKIEESEEEINSDMEDSNENEVESPIIKGVDVDLEEFDNRRSHSSLSWLTLLRNIGNYAISFFIVRMFDFFFLETTVTK